MAGVGFQASLTPALSAADGPEAPDLDDGVLRLQVLEPELTASPVAVHLHVSPDGSFDRSVPAATEQETTTAPSPAVTVDVSVVALTAP